MSKSTPGNSPLEVLNELNLNTTAAEPPAPDQQAFAKAMEKKHPGTIAVVNYKGGVGKTTATFFIGAQIAQEHPKKRVLIVDIDAQCSLTTVFGLDPLHGNEQNVLVLLKAGKAISPGSIRRESFAKRGSHQAGLPPNLFLLSGAFEVEDLDFELAQQKGMTPEEFFRQCRRVIALFHDFDYVLVDCPPNKMFLTQGMLRASSYYLVVAIPDKVSTYGIPRLLHWVDQIPSGERPKLVGALINRVIRTGSGITNEQSRWLTIIQNTMRGRALAGVVGLWPNSNKVCEVYGSGQSHLKTTGIWESGSRQAAVGDCVVETTQKILAACK